MLLHCQLSAPANQTITHRAGAVQQDPTAASALAVAYVARVDSKDRGGQFTVPALGHPEMCALGILQPQVFQARRGPPVGPQ